MRGDVNPPGEATLTISHAVPAKQGTTFIDVARRSPRYSQYDLFEMWESKGRLKYK